MTSLNQTVIALVRKLGHATVDDLMPHIEGFTRDQVIRALQNAKWHGWLTCDGRGPRVRGAGRKTATPGTYRPAQDRLGMTPRARKGPEPKRIEPKDKTLRLLRKQIPSVFHLSAHLGV